jgi:hypothetical protein
MPSHRLCIDDDRLIACANLLQAAENHGYPIETVVSVMQERCCGLNLVIVDACRSPARGMRSAADEAKSSRDWAASKGGGRNTLICNACKSLHTASDGVAGKNGLYTEALLKVRHMPCQQIPYACSGAQSF